MGLQHAFAMVGGLITPPLTVFRFTINFLDTKSQQYAISAALITSGICTLITVSKTPIPYSKYLFGRQLYIGSCVLSVMGVSFTFLPIYQIAITQMVADGIDGYTAYGKMLGTSIICALFPLVISVSPSKWISVRLLLSVLCLQTLVALGIVWLRFFICLCRPSSHPW